jgi:mannosyl-3-phosphoglycerate synthase
MRLAITSTSASVGHVDLHETFRVIELDAGQSVETIKSAGINGRSDSIPFSRASLNTIEAQLAIVVPCKDEDVSILDGVLHGIPRDCLIILVSNSRRANFVTECSLLSEFCTDTYRSGIIAHQHDAGIAQAFVTAGLPEIVREVDHHQQVRNGKGEAMMIGTALAKLAHRQYVGFIDADNLVAGAVHEYCKVYAAGLHYALHCTDNECSLTPHTMVRIKWNSKPKVKNGVIVFEKFGRSSRVVNEWMNRLLNALTGGNKEDKLVQTGNAGEHAMGINLALELQFATGYAVEPHQLIDAWERLGRPVPGTHESCAVPREAQLSYDVDHSHSEAVYNSSDKSTPSSSTSTSITSTPATSRPPSLILSQPIKDLFSPRKIRILQVETRNPHFHDTSKGDDHISAMQAGGLSTIYYSRLTPQKLRDDLRDFFKENLSNVNGVAEDGTPEVPRCYPSMQTMDFEVFRAEVKARSETLQFVGAGESYII